METLTIEIGLIEQNTGQIAGVPANPRTISDERLEALKRSIQDLPDMLSMRELLVYPLDGMYIVLGGNMRLRACIELGYTEMPCKVIPPSTPAEKLRAIIMQDNNEYGEMEWDMVASDWDADELKDWGVELPDGWNASDISEQQEAEEDDFSEDEAENAEPRVKHGEIWQLGEHRLMCGDCTQKGLLNKLTNGGGEMIDLYLTDPPYNVDYVGKTSDSLKIQNDKMEDSSFLHFLLESFQSASQIMKTGAPFYIWHADSEGYNFRKAVKDTGWLLKQCLIWNKNSMVMGRQDYQWKHEPCLYGWKPGSSHHWYGDRKQTTVIDFNKPVRNGEHPTMKPVGLFASLVRNSTKENDSVLDTFGGSGTTLIACEQLNRKCYMMELDPHYCDVIIARWEKLTGREAVKVYG